MWDCPKCHAKVDPSFEVCWQCGTSKDGVPDPSFVSADDSGPIADEFRDHPAVVLDDSLEEIAGSSIPELCVAYEAQNGIEAKFLVDQLGELRIPATYDEIDMHALTMSAARPKVYVQVEDLDRAHEWLAAYEQKRKHESIMED